MPNRKSGGCRCCGGIYPPDACTTYRVQVRNLTNAPDGSPIPGIAASLARRQGSITAFQGTLNPVTGVTDGDGSLAYALSTTTPENVTSATATIPDGGPSLDNSTVVKVGNVCTFPYTLCRSFALTNYLDGDGGTLGDRFIRGYALRTGVGTGPPGNSASYNFTVRDNRPGPGAYWGDRPDVADSLDGTCDGTSYYHQRFWSKAKYLLEPGGGLSDSRATVYLKTICVKIYRRPVQGGIAPTLLRQVSAAWDASTWDGDRTGPLPPGASDEFGNVRMRYAGGGAELLIYRDAFSGTNSRIGLFIAEVDNQGAITTSLGSPGGGFVDFPLSNEICNNGFCYSALISDGTCGPSTTPDPGTGGGPSTMAGDPPPTSGDFAGE